MTGYAPERGPATLNAEPERARRRLQPTVGAIASGSGTPTRFCVWAPDAMRVELEFSSLGRFTPMVRGNDGYFRLSRDDAPAGTLYRYRVDGRGPFPDPASRFQPNGVHGPSQVVDPGVFTWTDQAWRGIPRESLVLYELHVGTFTPEGTFRAATAKLPLLVELGVTAVELMPVADFPGDRNWGYDAVTPFSPARCYGTPDEFRAFVDAAHRAGLAVHLDVVYNHFGPDGAYQGSFSRYYYSELHSSPWGQGINFDGPGSAAVRRYVVENALHWMQEYHVDGLRLDATHAITDGSPRPIVAEITAAAHASQGDQALVIAEDHRNLAGMVRAVDRGGWGLDGVWSDDFHHQLRVALTGDRDGYFADFSGSDADIATTIDNGWFFHGQHSTFFDSPRGTDTSGIPLQQFVVCIQNHDQVGNRAYGERLNHDVEDAVYRAASTLLLVLPETPLLFMGQEWAASTPFCYFTDHHAELGRAVTAGRRREFRRFTRFAHPDAAASIPDPQSTATFHASRLRWEERIAGPHAGVLRLYQQLLALRRSEPALQAQPDTAARGLATARDGVIVVIRRASGARTLTTLVNLRGAATLSLGGADEGNPWQVVLTTEDDPFTADPQRLVLDRGPSVRFARAGAVILASEPAP